jgi:HTH-type transcriptional regulator/antitoxin HigA
MTEISRWHPSWSLPPGEVLVEALEERDMTQAELARRMARPLKTISEIATGKASITAETAIQLERAIGISAATWLGLESRYREAQARERDLADLEAQVGWLHNFPVRQLTTRGIIDRASPAPKQAAQLLAFFGVSNPAGWEQHWGQLAASYRMSERIPASRYSVAVWVRVAEREVGDSQLAAYQPARLRALVGELKPLTRALVVAGAIDRAKELLASAGVGLVLIEGITGAPASGAVRWIRGNPWIVLTLRHRTEDQLWFSLFHEIGHLLEGGRRRDVLEEAEDELARPDEGPANSFARESLLPQTVLETWLASTTLDRRSISEFAATQGVSPGIVVGRLQRDGRIDKGALNDLKQRL